MSVEHDFFQITCVKIGIITTNTTAHPGCQILSQIVTSHHSSVYKYLTNPEWITILNTPDTKRLQVTSVIVEFNNRLHGASSINICIDIGIATVAHVQVAKICCIRCANEIVTTIGCLSLLQGKNSIAGIAFELNIINWFDAKNSELEPVMTDDTNLGWKVEIS